MYEVIDTDGRILGLCLRANVPDAFRHGDYVRIPLERPVPELVGDYAIPAADDLTVDSIDLRLYEVALVPDRRGRLKSRWYLMTTKEVPEHMWKATNFIRFAWDKQR